MFRFKQFNVDQTGCAMKINTDGVLLGVMAGTAEPKTILDIGTGTGVIALMLAQRFVNAQVDAVEIDEVAAETAKQNFSGSPFNNRLTVYTDGFEGYLSKHPDRKYDLIISNPPFYINALASLGKRKSLAKHADEKFFDALVKSVSKHLAVSGEFWLILPLPTAALVKEIALTVGLNLQKAIDVLSYPDSVAHREILVLTSGDDGKDDEQFVIYNAPKVYSQQYEDALRPFFTIF
jgi:tRNA1Val (adenine37-N6)-methyltransferase